MEQARTSQTKCFAWGINKIQTKKEQTPTKKKSATGADAELITKEQSIFTNDRADPSNESLPTKMVLCFFAFDFYFVRANSPLRAEWAHQRPSSPTVPDTSPQSPNDRAEQPMKACQPKWFFVFGF